MSAAAKAQQPIATLYPYQKKWMSDKSRLMLGCWSRQIGKTHSTTLMIALDMVRHAALAGTAKEKKLLWVILSRGQRQSEEAMRAVQAHLEVIRRATKNPVIRQKLGEKLNLNFTETDVFGGERVQQGAIVLPGNVRCIGLPANPDTARGYSGNVYLDEFAFHQDSRKIWQAVYPIITRDGNRLIITSTPNGRNNKFYELWTGGGKQYSRHEVTVHDAKAAGYPIDVAELQEGIQDDDVWRQEYELQFLDEINAWLSHDLISQCEDPAAGKADKYAGGHCFLGVDIARRQHLWVSVVLEKVGDVLWLRDIEAHRDISFAEQERILETQHKRFDIIRGNYDQTGIGEKFVEDAQAIRGEIKAEGVIFTPTEKLDMANRLKETMSDRKLRLPVDRVLREDLHALRCITSATGAAKFVVESKETDGHADRTWALALACRAADVGKNHYAYRGVGRFNEFEKRGSRPHGDTDSSVLPVRNLKRRDLSGSGADLFGATRG